MRLLVISAILTALTPAAASALTDKDFLTVAVNCPTKADPTMTVVVRNKRDSEELIAVRYEGARL